MLLVVVAILMVSSASKEPQLDATRLATPVAIESTPAHNHPSDRFFLPALKLFRLFPGSAQRVSLGPTLEPEKFTGPLVMRIAQCERYQ